MPTYEYVCKSCGHLFEIVQSMRDDPLTECPECAGELRKVFAPPAIAFKGSGFYATDHGRKRKDDGDGKGSGGDTKTDAGAKKPGDKGNKKQNAGKPDKQGAGGSSSKETAASGSSSSKAPTKEGGS